MHNTTKTLLVFGVLYLFVSGCSYNVGYNPNYVPDEEPEHLSADEVILIMDEVDEEYVFLGKPTSMTGGGTTLEVPLGFILKEVSEEILEDRFSGGVDFANEFTPGEQYLFALNPEITGFEYRYNQLKNAGFAITPEVDLDLRVNILDREGTSIFNKTYNADYVSGESYILSGSPHEKINELIHTRIYELLEQSFDDARPIVVAQIDKVRATMALEQQFAADEIANAVLGTWLITEGNTQTSVAVLVDDGVYFEEFADGSRIRLNRVEEKSRERMRFHAVDSGSGAGVAILTNGKLLVFDAEGKMETAAPQ
jgi:hypothetical protein